MKKEQKRMVNIGLFIGVVLIGGLLTWMVMNPMNTGNQVPEGNYPGTYSFTEDDVGAENIEISWIASGVFEGDGILEVIEDFEDHYKVMKVYCHEGRIDCYAEMENRESGTIEFWLYMEKGGGAIGFYGVPFSTGFHVTWNYCSPNPSVYVIQNPTVGWHHVRIDFECGNGGYKDLDADHFDVHVDGIKDDRANWSFSQPQAVIGEIRLVTKSRVDSLFYYDAIGYSWDPNYNVGDNLIPT